MPEKLIVALIGNPNCGKTTLYNRLTGLHQKTGNWTGVTVEGHTATISIGGQPFEMVDLPGIYALSLEGEGEDERHVQQYLSQQRPDIILNVANADSLERSLFLTTELLEYGIPMVIVLNMVDEAERKGKRIDTDKLRKPACTCPPGRIASLTRSPDIKAQVDNTLALCGLTPVTAITDADWLLVDASTGLSPEQQATLQSIDPKKTQVLVLAYAHEDIQALAESLPADARRVLLPLTPRSLYLALTGTGIANNPPASESSPDSPDTKALGEAHAPTTRPVKVLVVEDNPINHQVATEMLEKSGFVVDVVESGEEALTRVRDEDYDIILSDYHLPDLNGIDMAHQLAQRQLQQGREPTPVVLVTADLTDSTWHKAAAAGIRSLLPKPFSQQALVDAIAAVLNPDY